MKSDHRTLKILRWIARSWSLLTLFVVLMVIFGPGDENPSDVTLKLEAWLVLSMYAVATLGLLLAWRWEALGAIVAILAILIHNIGLFLLLKQFFPLNLLIGAFWIIPAILFLVCRWLSRGLPELSTSRG